MPRGYLWTMREVGHVPHPLMRITIHSYNGQYRLRFELDQFEQSFKFPEMDHELNDVRRRAEAMQEGVLLRMVDMRSQYIESLNHE